MPLPSILGLAAILLATVLMVPVLAGQPPATPTGNTQVPEFEYEPLTLSCSEGFSYAVYPAGDFGNDTGTEIQPEELEGLVRFRVPSLEGGQYVFERSCPDSDSKLPDSESVRFDHSRVLVTKAVVGAAPTDASFTVNVACEDIEGQFLDEDRQFGGDGGDAQVVFYATDFSASSESVTCTITEPEDGGAEGVFIEPQTLTYAQFSDGSSTVTNTVPEAAPSPEPSPEPSPTPEVDDTVEEAEPAEPVEVEPDFTG